MLFEHGGIVHLSVNFKSQLYYIWRIKWSQKSITNHKSIWIIEMVMLQRLKNTKNNGNGNCLEEDMLVGLIIWGQRSIKLSYDACNCVRLYAVNLTSPFVLFIDIGTSRLLTAAASVRVIVNGTCCVSWRQEGTGTLICAKTSRFCLV